MTREALRTVLRAFPQAQVSARVYDRLHMMELGDLDLSFAERELFEGAVAMGRWALTAHGIPPAEVDRVEREYRLRDCERLERQTETGDVRAGWERAFAADRPLADDEPAPA